MYATFAADTHDIFNYSVNVEFDSFYIVKIGLIYNKMC